MEHQEGGHNEEAALYARIIVGWHAGMGMDQWQRRFKRRQDERLVRYQHAVARFHDSDLSDPAIQLAIAREQIAGSMEWAYGVTVPEQLPGFEGPTRTWGTSLASWNSWRRGLMRKNGGRRDGRWCGIRVTKSFSRKPRKCMLWLLAPMFRVPAGRRSFCPARWSGQTATAMTRWSCCRRRSSA